MAVTVDYDDYIISPEWRQRCAEARLRAGNKCQLCGETRGLHVHHNTYARLGAELPTDIVVLCTGCHRIFHAKRDKRTAEKYKAEQWMIDAKKAKPQTPKPPAPAPLPPPAPTPRHIPTNEYIDIIVTVPYLESLVGASGSITAKGLDLIGEPASGNSGWRTRPIGRKLTVNHAALVAEQARVKAKRDGTYVKPPPQKQGPRIFTAEELEQVQREYAGRVRRVNYKKYLRRWGQRHPAEQVTPTPTGRSQ